MCQLVVLCINIGRSRALIFAIKGKMETIPWVAFPWETKTEWKNVPRFPPRFCPPDPFILARSLPIAGFRFQDIMQVAYHAENERGCLVLWLENYELLPADDGSPRQNWDGDRNDPASESAEGIGVRLWFTINSPLYWNHSRPRDWNRT